MKKIVFLAAALMASMFILTSCEKENVAEMAENNDEKASNYVLMQKGYISEDGFVGNLYIDENNPDNMYFEIYSQNTSRGIADVREPDGTAYKKVVREVVHYECSGEKTNCWKINIDGKPTIGWLPGTEITLK